MSRMLDILMSSALMVPWGRAPKSLPVTPSPFCVLGLRAYLAIIDPRRNQAYRRHRVRIDAWPGRVRQDPLLCCP